jgi:hypothetical protein
MFKKVLPFLPSFVCVLYYNAFIRSSFSYCLMFWFHNDRSGRCKLINKIDHLIVKLASICKQPVNEFVAVSRVCDLWKSLNLQMLSFMYDICNNCIVYNFLPCVTNNAVHGHVTRSSTNLHITTVSSLDKHNFIYNCSVAWNKCPLSLRNLPKRKFMASCKSLMFA